MSAQTVAQNGDTTIDDHNLPYRSTYCFLAFRTLDVLKLRRDVLEYQEVSGVLDAARLRATLYRRQYVPMSDYDYRVIAD